MGPVSRFQGRGGGRGRGGRGGGGRTQSNQPTLQRKQPATSNGTTHVTDTSPASEPSPVATSSTPAGNTTLDHESKDYFRYGLALSYLNSKSSDQPQADWILLDSCSTGNLISNKSLLHNIHDASHPLRVQSIGGSILLTQ